MYSPDIWTFALGSMTLAYRQSTSGSELDARHIEQHMTVDLLYTYQSTIEQPVAMQLQAYPYFNK